ncbi:MAG: LamG-like jellyroll fold domain-containing protein, partial [Candidatus Heimdallarchaeota archaeon]
GDTNPSVIFSGDDYVEIPVASVNATTKTVEFLFNLTNLTATHTLFGFYTSDTNHIYFQVEATTGKIIVWKNNAQVYISTETLVAATNYHIIITDDNTTTTIYINGVALVLTTGATLTLVNDDNIHLGGLLYNTIYTPSLVGKLDEFLIFNTILSGVQIADHYAKVTDVGATVFYDQMITDGALRYYRLDEIVSATIIVNSTNDTQTTTLGYLIAPPPYSAYYAARYTLDSDPSYQKYWLYQENLGTYPNLSGDGTGEYDTVEMLPIIPIRTKFQSLNDPTHPDYSTYATSKEILDVINIDIDEIITSVEDNTNNNDIDKIEDAFILFGVNIYTTSTPGRKALFILFRNMFVNATVTKAV